MRNPKIRLQRVPLNKKRQKRERIGNADLGFILLPQPGLQRGKVKESVEDQDLNPGVETLLQLPGAGLDHVAETEKVTKMDIKVTVLEESAAGREEKEEVGGIQGADQEHVVEFPLQTELRGVVILLGEEIGGPMTTGEIPGGMIGTGEMTRIGKVIYLAKKHLNLTMEELKFHLKGAEQKIQTG